MPIRSADCLVHDYDVCIVGGGFAGLAAAFGCFDLGLRVLLIEAGHKTPVTAEQTLGSPVLSNPAHHAPIDHTSCMALGGSSHWWGGRSVLMDPVDFEDRSPCGSPGWPIRFDEMAPWFAEAAQFLGSTPMQIDAPGRFADLTRHDASQSESWGPELNIAQHMATLVNAPKGPAILLRTRMVGLSMEDGKLRGIRVSRPEGPARVHAQHVILACGGLGVLRVMLNAVRTMPGLIAGQAHLGKGYMGHLTGSIADLVPADTRDIQGFGCLPSTAGAAIRRQIRPRAETLRRHGCTNIAFWLDNAPLADPGHGSGAASAKYLLLRQKQLGRRIIADGLRARAVGSPDTELRPHLANIAHHPLETAWGLSRALWGRFRRRHLRPEVLRSSGRGGWRLHYHAEQRCDLSNQVRLTDVADADGLYGLEIDYRFQSEDFDSVIRSHEALDQDLQASAAGRLRYLKPPDACRGTVEALARDGYHQLGGARMSEGPETGVVSPQGRVHGLANLWIASSSVFPSAGQANPTLTVVALARRLAADVSDTTRSAIM